MSSTKRKLSELTGSDHSDLETRETEPLVDQRSDTDTSESVDEAEELSTGVPGHQAILTPAGDTQQTLLEEIESLEAVVARLDQEKHALKTRLNEVMYFQKFKFGDCKKWLAANYEFDRKDTPELLAGIVENYLMQSEHIEPLPHQLLVKNSSRAQARRERMIQSRSVYRREKDAAVPEPVKTKKISPRSQDRDINRRKDSLCAAGAFGQFLYISVVELDKLYAEKPWHALIDRWPKIQADATNSDAQFLMYTQEKFLQQNAWALWERNHWFPIKQENGKTPDECKLLARHHNRRKRRQALLKERLEHMSVDLRAQMEKSLLEQSIFSVRWVETILKRPKLWIPREDEPLLPQIRALDAVEPDRNFYLLDSSL